MLWWKVMTKQLRKEGIYLAYTLYDCSSSKEEMAGTQIGQEYASRSWCRGCREVLLTGLLFMASQPAFLQTPRRLHSETSGRLKTMDTWKALPTEAEYNFFLSTHQGYYRKRSQTRPWREHQSTSEDWDITQCILPGSNSKSSQWKTDTFRDEWKQEHSIPIATGEALVRIAQL